MSKEEVLFGNAKNSETVLSIFARYIGEKTMKEQVEQKLKQCEFERDLLKKRYDELISRNKTLEESYLNRVQCMEDEIKKLKGRDTTQNKEYERILYLLKEREKRLDNHEKKLVETTQSLDALIEERKTHKNKM